MLPLHPSHIDERALATAERLSDEGKLEEAAGIYAGILQATPCSADALFGLATNEQQLGLFSSSKTHYEAALAAVGENAAPALRSLILQRLGLVAYQLALAPQAVAYWKQAYALEENEEILSWIEEAERSCTALVSIIVSVYNYARFLNDSIGSIFAQTYKNLEVIIVNDCSTDDTDEVVSDLARRYAFRYITNPENRGVAYTLNAGSEFVTGKYTIAFDADDILLPDAVQAHVDNLEKNPKAGLSYGKMYVLLPNGSTLEEPMPDIQGDIFDYILCGTFILPCMAMYRTSVWKMTPGYDEATTLQDLDMGLELLKRSHGARLDQFVSYYRRHAGSESDLKQQSAQKRSYRGRMAVLRKWRDEPMYELAWMHRWKYHDKAISDAVIHEMLQEGDEDDYLHYRASLAASKADTWTVALHHSRLALTFVRPGSYVASVIHVQHLRCLKRTGNLAEALEFARNALKPKIEFKTAEFFWEAAEFLLSTPEASAGKGYRIYDEAMKLYKACLVIGEPSQLYYLQRGSGTFLPAFRLGKMFAADNKHGEALKYFRIACEFGFLPAFVGHAEIRRLRGELPGIKG